MDILLAARRTGPEGAVIGVDMTPAMCEAAREAADQAGMSRTVEIYEGFYEQLPIEDQSLDVVLSNGVVNLSPDKADVFREIHRVLRPGGRLYLADVVVQRELKYDVRNDPDLWAACIAGALHESELAELAVADRFSQSTDRRALRLLPGYAGRAKLARDLRVHAVNFYARK